MDARKIAFITSHIVGLHSISEKDVDNQDISSPILFLERWSIIHVE
jgi:hypothetical protein